MISAINCGGGGPTCVLMRLQEGLLVVESRKECRQAVLRAYWSWPQTWMVRVNLHILLIVRFFLTMEEILLFLRRVATIEGCFVRIDDGRAL